jgi:ribose transport system permease protein
MSGQGRAVKSEKIKNFIIEQKIILIIIVIGIFLSLRSEYFLTFNNVISIFSAISFEGIIAIGMALLIIIGEIDLSVGYIMSFSALLAVMLQPFGIFPGIIAGIIGGTFLGLINGMLVIKFKLPSIAVTLGTMVFLKGLVLAITKQHTLKGENSNFLLIGEANLFQIPIYVIIFILLVIIFEFILQKSFFGRNVFAIGGNRIASKFSGIRVELVRVLCFVLTGFFSGLAGVLLTGKLNVASGNIGQLSNVYVITAVLLGGISMEGGEGNIFKAFQGILLLGILNNAMTIMKMSSHVQEIVRGLLLILIIVIDSINIHRKKFL